MNVHSEYDSLYDQEMKQFVQLLDALAGLRQLLTELTLEGGEYNIHVKVLKHESYIYIELYKVMKYISNKPWRSMRVKLVLKAVVFCGNR